MWDIPISSVIPIIITIFQLAVTSALAVIVARINHNQKGYFDLINLRRVAYGTILAALNSVEVACDAVDSSIADDSHAYFDTKQRHDHEKEMREKLSLAHRKYSEEYLVISDGFISLYEAFQAELLVANQLTDSYPNDHESFSGVIRKFRPLLLDKAKDDLAIYREGHGLFRLW